MKIIIAVLLVVTLAPLSGHAGNLQELKQAAEAGKPRAQYDLAMMYLKGDGVEKDSASAIKWLQRAAEQDFSAAQYKLGMLYREGRKTTADIEKAIEYLTMAADQGNPSAQYMLGEIYLQGDDVAQDLDEAQEWLELAMEHGYSKAREALETLAKIREDNEVSLVVAAPTAKASTAIKAPADTKPEDKDTTAQAAHAQGMKYLRGSGVSRDYKEAAKWFTRAAELGYAESQYQLGELFKKGKGVKRNKKLANKWYRAAAKQGHIKAKNRLDGCGFC
ncbi:MAG TPA: sel1 repeat family protein [Gammaproteobacteria bacterium]|nr:sel1 repeat family protein [Gammaproteobacteria bacterium]